MSNLTYLLNRYLSWLDLPHIQITDVVEVLILAFAVYEVLIWIKDSRAWVLLKGLAVLAAFIVIAYIFQFNTILWIVKNLLSVLILAMVIIFQPELRKALERLGQNNVFASLFSLNLNTTAPIAEVSEATINNIIRACYAMGTTRTGALIVIENRQKLDDYSKTGIELDSVVSTQLLINIFEHNTPLHDGAVIVRGNRIVAATCYLPLSLNRSINKQLGTRHRAGIGMSEETDSIIVIVSEETGAVSYAEGGKLYHDVSRDELSAELSKLLRTEQLQESLLDKLKGWLKHEKN